MSVSDFRIDVPDEVLADLRERLARTRFTDRPPPHSRGRRAPTPTTCGPCWPTGPTGSTGARPRASSTFSRTTRPTWPGGAPLPAHPGRRRCPAPAADPHPRLAEQLRGDAAAGHRADRSGAARRRVRRGGALPPRLPASPSAAGRADDARDDGADAARADDRRAGYPRYGAFGGDIGPGCRAGWVPCIPGAGGRDPRDPSERCRPDLADRSAAEKRVHGGRGGLRREGPRGTARSWPPGRTRSRPP